MLECYGLGFSRCWPARTGLPRAAGNTPTRSGASLHHQHVYLPKSGERPMKQWCKYRPLIWSVCSLHPFQSLLDVSFVDLFLLG